MIFGFTGTQQGMTSKQIWTLKHLMRELATGNDEFHHGDCVGADQEAHHLAREFQFYIVVHPPINGSKRAYTLGDKVLPVLTYLCRNREIVNVCDVLLATPKEDHEVLRSGTWSTIRYALKRRKPYYVILPDGSVVHKEPRR